MSVVIRKYENRKLYNEEKSQYLSMLELATLAAKRDDLKVVCDRTGRDLTLETLARALYERIKESSLRTSGLGPDPFPARALTKLIALVPVSGRR